MEDGSSYQLLFFPAMAAEDTISSSCRLPLPAVSNSRPQEETEEGQDLVEEKSMYTIIYEHKNHSQMLIYS